MNEHWYEWKGSCEKGKFVKVLNRKPKEYNNVVSFWGSRVLREEEIVTE